MNRRVAIGLVLALLALAAACQGEKPSEPPVTPPAESAPGPSGAFPAPPPPQLGTGMQTVHDARNQQSADAERAACLDKCQGEPDCMAGCEQQYKQKMGRQ